MRFLFVVLAAFVFGCARQTPPASAPTQKASSTAGAWQRWELPLAGLSAEFPAKPEQLETSKPSDEGSISASSLVASYADHFLGVTQNRREGRDRLSDDDWIEAIREKLAGIERFEPLEFGDFRGVSIWQTTEGKRTASWHLFVGDGTVSAFVSADPAKFDEAMARRFFASLSFELPWRIYSAPTGMLSIAVPAAAVEVPGEKLSYGAEGPSRAFFVGGKYDLMFVVGSVEIDPVVQGESDDELLGRVMAALAAQGSVMSWQSPVQFESARGVDYLSDFKGTQIRGRVLRVDHYLYSLEIRAKSKSLILSDKVKRFFESLRWY